MRWGALADGADRLACECGRPDCAAGDKPGSAVVLYVVADQATIDGTGDNPGYTIDPDDLFPPELVADLSCRAKLVPVVHPCDAPPERGYTASRHLADFVRCRDLTCRFPGCDRPAINCDIDHTVPFGEGGRTHASNLKCLCRVQYKNRPVPLRVVLVASGRNRRPARDTGIDCESVLLGSALETMSLASRTHVSRPSAMLSFSKRRLTGS